MHTTAVSTIRSRLLVAGACCIAVSASAADVSGSFNSTDTKYGAHPYAVTVTDGVAYRAAARFDADKQVTVVVLADKPIDAAALTAAPDRRAAVKQQMEAAKGDYVEWEVSEGSNSPTLAEHVASQSGVNNLSDMFTAAYKTNDANHIAGHVGNDPAGKDYPTD
jgi:hypothetical protein